MQSRTNYPVKSMVLVYAVSPRPPEPIFLLMKDLRAKPPFGGFRRFGFGATFGAARIYLRSTLWSAPARWSIQQRVASGCPTASCPPGFLQGIIKGCRSTRRSDRPSGVNPLGAGTAYSDNATEPEANAARLKSSSAMWPARSGRAT